MKIKLENIGAAVVRLNPALAPSPQVTHPIDHESDLHDYISMYCREHGWLAFHGSMAHRTRRTEGEPDFIILAPGRVLMIECKARGGKCSPAQNAVIAMATSLGHQIHVVDSIEAWNKIAKIYP